MVELFSFWTYCWCCQLADDTYRTCLTAVVIKPEYQVDGGGRRDAVISVQPRVFCRVPLHASGLRRLWLVEGICANAEHIQHALAERQGFFFAGREKSRIQNADTHVWWDPTHVVCSLVVEKHLDF